MLELYLSTDGKHTVHATAQTPEEMAALAPKAKALYKKVLEEFGTKAALWQSALHGNGHANGQATSNDQAQTTGAPLCPMHKRPMKYREGRLGPFWSCPTRKPDGRWCPITKEVTTASNGQSPAR